MTDEGSLVLYADSNFFSPYVLSVFVSLTEKGIPFEMKTVDLQAQEHCQSAYANISFSRRVPTLVQGKFSLSESSAICEYLEEQYPFPHYPRIYPAGLRARAIARELQAWLRSDLLPIRVERSTEVIFCGRQEGVLSEGAIAATEKLFAAANRLLNEGSRYLFGNWCIADTDLAVMLNRLVANGDDVPDNLKTYALRQWERPSVQAWLQLSQAQRMLVE